MYWFPRTLGQLFTSGYAAGYSKSQLLLPKGWGAELSKMKTEPRHRSSSGQDREDPSGQNHLLSEVGEFRRSLKLPGEKSRSLPFMWPTWVGPIGERSTLHPVLAPEPSGVHWRSGHARTILDTLSH